MLAKLREWTRYAAGTVVFVLVGTGIPLLLLEHLRSVIVSLPGGHA